MSSALIFPTQNFWNDKNGNGWVDTGEVNSPVMDSSFIQGIVNAVVSTAGSSNFFFDPSKPPTVTNGASVGDRVWLDSNRDGMQSTGEAGVANVRVKLFSTFGGFVSETTTDANGNYGFSNLPSALYYLQFVTPSGYSFTRRDVGLDNYDSEADAQGYTRSTWLLPGQSYSSFDAGLVPTQSSAAIGNKVWLDANGNGQQDATELGRAGVVVNLRDATSQLRSTVTDQNGNYRFDGLALGQYQVEFVAPTDFRFTQADVGNDDLDSDAAVSSGRTALFTLGAGEDLSTIDAGLVSVTNRTASIGDRVWLDANGNGIQDATEQGVAGVSVVLMRTDINYIQAPPEVRVTSDSYGNYKFTGLEAGRYQVKFILPNGYRFTRADIGTDLADSDANQQSGLTAEFSLASGEQQLTVDAGLISNEQSQQNASIRSRVWLDSNRNGIQDSGEAGHAGIKVSLYSSESNFWSAPLATATTDSSGIYQFNALAAGRYRIKVDWPGFGYRFADKAQGSDRAKDSDVDNMGYSDYVDLVAGNQLGGLDVGLVSVFTFPWLNTSNNNMTLPSFDSVLFNNNFDNLLGGSGTISSSNSMALTDNTVLNRLFPLEV